MEKLELDPRLARDCIVLGELGNSLLLLMNNSLVPWFILVPKVLETEFVDLPTALQVELLEEINTVSAFLTDSFDVTKLNIATIGNVVSQLHVHIVGRNPSDYCWPDVVWGNKQGQVYSDEHIENIIKQLGVKLEGRIHLYRVV